MAREVVILGAGGHCKVIIDLLEQNQEYKIKGIIDSSKEKMFVGIPIIGDDSDLGAIYNDGVTHAFVAIGNNGIRRKLIECLKEIGYTLINVISPTAIVSKHAELGTGIVIMPGSIINAYAEIEDGCIINTSATIDHDTKIKAFSHIAPGTHIAGNSSVGEGSFLGVGTNVIDGVHIGSNVTVGAGSTVIGDIQDNCIVVGTPAKVIKMAK